MHDTAACSAAAKPLTPRPASRSAASAGELCAAAAATAEPTALAAVAGGALALAALVALVTAPGHLQRKVTSGTRVVSAQYPDIPVHFPHLYARLCLSSLPSLPPCTAPATLIRASPRPTPEKCTLQLSDGAQPPAHLLMLSASCPNALGSPRLTTRDSSCSSTYSAARLSPPRAQRSSAKARARRAAVSALPAAGVVAAAASAAAAGASAAAAEAKAAAAVVAAGTRLGWRRTRIACSRITCVAALAAGTQGGRTGLAVTCAWSPSHLDPVTSYGGKKRSFIADREDRR